MYDEIVIGPRERDGRWEEDHAALQAAWKEIGVHPAPIMRFSIDISAVGHFLLSAGVITGAFGALRTWMQGRAGRKVAIRLADGTEMQAATAEELDKMAVIVERLNQQKVSDQEGTDLRRTD